MCSGTRFASSSSDSDGRHGNKDGRDREVLRPAGNDHCHRTHCMDGCGAARGIVDGPVADFDQKPDHPDASSANWTGT